MISITNKAVWPWAYCCACLQYAFIPLDSTKSHTHGREMIQQNLKQSSLLYVVIQPDFEVNHPTFDMLLWSSFVEPSADISGVTMLQPDHMYDCYAINKGTELTVHSRLSARVARTPPKPPFHLRFYAACDLVSTRNGETINSGDKCYNPLTG